MTLSLIDIHYRYSFPVGFEAFCIELNLQKKMAFVFITLTMDSLNIISKNWEKPLKLTRKHLKTIMGDSNIEISESNLTSSGTFYRFESLINLLVIKIQMILLALI